MSTITYRLPYAAGKLFRGADPSPAEAAGGAFAGVLYRILRQEIEAGNTSSFLQHFGENTNGHWLRRHRSNVQFSVDGYATDEREIYEIPEIRAYLAQLNGKLPAWSFFGDLATPNLVAVIACVAPIRAIHKMSDSVVLAIGGTEVHSLLTGSLPAAALLYHFSGIAPKSAVRHIKQVASYLGTGS